MDLIKKITKHKNVIITSRGNEAIEIALRTIKSFADKKIILIPDQGGWLSYKEIAKKCGFEVKELKTDRGVIILDELKNNLDNAAAFLFTSFAGYYAEQPLKKISKLCKEKNVCIIEDASGSFGDKKLCNGKLSDFIVCSFGEWKIVDYGEYGFVSSNHSLLGREAITKIPVELENKIKRAPERLRNLLKKSKKVKKELRKFNIFHRKRRGPNIIVEYKDEILEYCKEKGYDYVICPKSYKVNEKAISIELKRLNL